MVNTVYLVTTLIFCVLLEFGNCQQDIGYICTLPTDAQGRCALLKTCRSAIQDLQKGIYPVTCGFQGDKPIVCCDETVQEEKQPLPTARPTIRTSATARPTIRTSTTARPTIRTSTTARPTIRTSTAAATIPYSIYTTIPSTALPFTQVNLQVGARSRQKCREYSKHAFQDSTSFTLDSGHGGPISYDCTISSVTGMRDIKSKPKEFPHMALVGFDDGSKGKVWQCGGTLISERFVLTAAHCLYHREYGAPKYVRLGDLMLNDNTDDADPQDFEISETTRHPDYKPPSRYNDIALLKLNKDVHLNPYARPACLNPNKNVNFQNAIASGWSQGLSLSPSDHLLKVQMDYVPNVACNNSYKNNIGMRLQRGIVEEQLCANFRDIREDACQDTGGPLQIINKDENCMYTIIGVSSLAKACGLVNVPTVYTRISSYIGWIENIVWA